MTDATAIFADDGYTYYIAEAGVNHNGDLSLAEDLINAAADAGADAVKFQTFDPDRLVSPAAEKASYQQSDADDETQYEMLQQYELSRSEHGHLREYCVDRGITFLSSPFDKQSADLLDDLDVPMIKLGSGELDNLPLVEHVASFGRPMLVSTGMATMDEVERAYDTIRATDSDIDVCFLHCVSAYPCDIDTVNLRAMGTMRTRLDTPVGFSDHTLQPETTAFAAAAGASVVEKHFTLDSEMEGPDHSMSLKPDELRRSVELVRSATRARGTPEKEPVPAEEENITATRKSLHTVTALSAGTRLSAEDVVAVRPADGLSPRYLADIVGSTIRRDIPEGDPVREADLHVALGTGDD